VEIRIAGAYPQKTGLKYKNPSQFIQELSFTNLLCTGIGWAAALIENAYVKLMHERFIEGAVG
jgi:hypothetical protein